MSCGLRVMAWSPEQDLVVFVSQEDKLLLMTREFDIITELSLHPKGFGEGLCVVA